MAFVDITPTVHLGRLTADQTPFTAPIPAKHPGILEGLTIDEGFEIGRPQMPPRQAFCRVRLRDRRDLYESRQLQSGDFLVVQDSEDGGAATVRFRGRIRTPRVRDQEHGRIVIEIEAHGLWTRLRQADDVQIPEIMDAVGKQIVDSVLDQIPWPSTFRNVPTAPTGADVELASWVYEGPPAHGIALALQGIHPRSKFFVDAAGIARAVWLSSNLVQYRANEVRPTISRQDTELHVLNQIVASAIEILRTTTARFTSSTVYTLTDDSDTVIFEDEMEGGDEDAVFLYEFRQPNGTYFTFHDEIVGSLTAVPIEGTTKYQVVATARARSADVTTVSNQFRIRSVVLTLQASGDPPLVVNLNGVAPAEPKQFIVPELPYPSGHAATLGANYLALWGNPHEITTFEAVANDSAILPRLRSTGLWDRVSLFDGNDTHFGFAVRKEWDYGQRSVVRLTMLEDFTEGGDIAVPFRHPFEWIFNSIAALDMFFDRASMLSNQGAWAEDTNGGSTPSGSTGPTANNIFNFVHTETSGGSQGDHEDNGIIVLKDDDPFDALVNRDVIFRYAAYGDFVTGNGLKVQGRTVTTIHIDDLILIERAAAQRAVWRINLGDTDDATDPYGEIGAIPANAGGINALGIDANGDLLAAADTGDALWRINIADPDDETGDYGEVGDFPAGLTQPTAGAVDSNGDLWLIDLAGRQLWRIDPESPGSTTGGYGLIGVFEVSGDTARSMAFNAAGHLLGILRTGGNNFLYRIDKSDPTNMTAPFGSQGVLPPSAIEIRAFAIDSNDDGWVVNRSNQLFKINLSDPDDTTGDYGQALTLPTGITEVGGAAMDLREASNFGQWTDIDTLPASVWPGANLSEGDTDTDVDGTDYTVAADGGWRDYTVAIPNTYQQLRLIPELNSGGNAIQQDIALRSIRSR